MTSHGTLVSPTNEDRDGGTGSKGGRSWDRFVPLETVRESGEGMIRDKGGEGNTVYVDLQWSVGSRGGFLWLKEMGRCWLGVG